MNKKDINKTLAAIASIGILYSVYSCSQRQQKNNHAVVIHNFDSNRYLGTWYEVARFDFKFEKDLKNVTADYSIRDDGKIKVVNKGYNTKKEKWSEAIGKAKFVGDKSSAALKVSFFGPFYSEYNIVKLSPDYQTALIFGKNTDYMWILSRNKTMDEATKSAYLKFAIDHGYDVNKLVWTEQE